MKLLSGNRLPRVAMVFSAVWVVGLCSCEKVQELTSSAKEWFGDDEESGDGKVTDVESVSRAKGTDVIHSEDRLVMVEFFSDT